MKLGEEWAFEKVDFEGDAQNIVNAINSPEICLAWYSELVEEAKDFLIHNPLWTVSFIHRERNQVAHVMAKLGIDVIQTKQL